MFSIGIFGLILASSVAVFELLTQQRLQQTTMDAHIAAALIRSNVTAHLQNNTALTNTINSPENAPAFNCIVSGTPCPAGQQNFNVIRDAANAIVVDTRGANGLALAGSLCGSYSAAGSMDCPFKLQATWEAICVAPCNPPVSMRISINFTYSPTQQTPFSPLAHNFVMDRSQP